jgi:hypothetical protein
VEILEQPDWRVNECGKEKPAKRQGVSQYGTDLIFLYFSRVRLE